MGAAIRTVACSSEIVVTGSSKPIVKVWQVTEAAVKQTQTLAILEHGAVGSSCVEVAGESDGQLAAVCYDDGGIGLWDLRNCSMVMELAATIPTSWKAKFLPGNRRVVSAGPSGSLCFWDLRSNGRLEAEVGGVTKGEDALLDPIKRRRTESLDKPKSPIFSLAVSPDGGLLGCGRASGAISVMRLESQEWAGDVNAHSGDQGSSVRAMTFDSQSRLILSGGDDHHACLFDAESWARAANQKARRCSQLERFCAHRGCVTSVSACPDPHRRVMVTTSWDSTVRLWDYCTHELLQTYKEHKDSVFASAFAPIDGRFFVTSGVDAQLVLYAAKHKTSTEESALALLPTKVK